MLIVLDISMSKFRIYNATFLLMHSGRFEKSLVTYFLNELTLFQLRGAQILDAVRLHKNGFPECLTYGEFWRRYRILAEDSDLKKEPGHSEMKSAVEELLGEMDLDKSAFRLGNTQVSEEFLCGSLSSVFPFQYLKVCLNFQIFPKRANRNFFCVGF